MVLRAETRRRARALQLLYAWELHGRPPLREVVESLLRGTPAWRTGLEEAEPLAAAVGQNVEWLDGEVERVAENWRIDRIGIIEHNILRLAVYELDRGEAPPRVVINEAVRLAHWFAGAKAPAFVNGVLDALARQAGKL
jgi:N utilization substance protein B